MRYHHLPGESSNCCRILLEHIKIIANKNRINDTIRGEKIAKLKDQLKQLESRQLIEQKRLPNIKKPWKKSKARWQRSKTISPKPKKGCLWDPVRRYNIPRGLKETRIHLKNRILVQDCGGAEL